MSYYCLQFKKNTENINPRVSKTSNCKTMLLSKCATFGCKKSRFIKKQEDKVSNSIYVIIISFRLTTVVMITQIIYQMISKLFI